MNPNPNPNSATEVHGEVHVLMRLRPTSATVVDSFFFSLLLLARDPRRGRAREGCKNRR